MLYRHFTKLSRYTRVSLLALLFALSPLVSIFGNSPAYADVSAPTLVAAYASTGTEIGLSGNLMQNVAVLKKFGFSPTYTSSAKVVGSNGVACQASVSIAVNPNNDKTGTLTFSAMPPVIQRSDQPAPSPQYCTADLIKTLPSGTIAVGGDKTDPNPPSNVAPPAVDPTASEIDVTVYSDKPASQLPGGMEVHLTGVSGLNEVRTLDWKGSSAAFVHFDGKAAGGYQVCVTPTGTFTFPQCQSVTKVDGKTAFVEIGSADAAYNEKGKLVTVKVNYSIPQFTGNKTYGPVGIKLLTSDGKLVSDSTQTGTKTWGSDDGTGQTSAQSSYLDAKIDGVEPGDYKVCVSGTEICSDVFTKVANKSIGAVINLTLDQSSQLLNTKGASPPTCGSTVTGIGWILCPVLNAMGGLADGMWHLAAALLTVSPLRQTGDGSDVAYSVWGAFRSFANVILVIVFMVIIYSQLTGAGINNYGIKKMLPRLIIGAILINISYFIVQIAVDVSNILGNSIYDLINGLATQSPPTWEGLIGLVVGTGAATGLAIGGVALAGGPMFVLLLMLPAVAVAVLGFLAALVVLIIRQALIPILAILAPLAFVAYMLPNTQQWFNKWRSAFMSMLMLFPIAAIMFGGVKISAIIINSQGGWWSTLIALVVLGAPLFMLPFIARQGGPILSKAAGTLQGFANKARKPIEGFTKPRADLAREQYAAGTARAGLRGAGQRMYQGMRRSALTRETDQKTATSQFHNGWEESTGGIRSLDALAKSEMEGQVGKAHATSRVANSADGQELIQQLKSTETQAAIDKAASDVEYTTTGDLELQLKAKVANANAEAYKTEQDALFKEISSRAGAAQVTGVSDDLKLAAQYAARGKNLNDLRTNSAARELQKEQAADIKDLSTGQAVYAAGVDPSGVDRVRATAISTEQAATSEAIKHRISLIQDDSTADTLIDNAQAALQQANANGDSVAARAATQILGSQTGNAGLIRLDETIEALETAGGINSSIVEGVKIEAVAAGVKGRNVTIDTWATDKTHRTLAAVAADPATANKLNFRETSTQAPAKLEQWRIGGQLTEDQAKAVMNAYEKGTLELDADKVTIFKKAAAGNRDPIVAPDPNQDTLF